MFCKSCGRSLFDSGEERFCCPYCGAEVIASESAADGGFESASANPSGTWTRAGLKERALALLSPGYWPLVLVSLVAIVIGDYGGAFLRHSSCLRVKTSTTVTVQPKNLIEACSSAILPVDTMTMVVLLVVALALVMILVSIPIAVGVRKYFVGRHRGTARLKDLFFAFCSGHYWNVVLVVLMHDLAVLLWSLLLIIPGWVKAYALRMVVYELADNPAISWREAFDISERVMQGQKWDSFVLDLSFILWWLLSGLTCGFLDVFFVVPYFGLTSAGLYETLLGGKSAAERGDESGIDSRQDAEERNLEEEAEVEFAKTDDGKVVLRDGVYVHEAEGICRELERANIPFELCHVSKEGAGIVESHKNNWATDPSVVSNCFSHGGLGVYLRILVHPEDVDRANEALAPKEGKRAKTDAKTIVMWVVIAAAVFLFVYAFAIRACREQVTYYSELR